MNKRRLERVAVTVLSIVMLLSSTGIVGSLASNVGVSSFAPLSNVSKASASVTVKQEGGKVTTTSGVTGEGGSLDAASNGDGTQSNPYCISNADEFISMQNLINMTTDADKYFVLTADIDLSAVTESDLAKNNGSIVTINKSLANSSKNVFVNLDGKGHKITGFNISAKSLTEISIFGYLNEKSVISNLTVVKPSVTSKSADLKYAAVLAKENDGLIKDITVSYPVVTLDKSNYTGVVAAVNNGTISNVSVIGSHSNASAASADSHTISAPGYVGGVSGVNNGTIVSVSALNIGAFIPEGNDKLTIYGGVAGQSNGSISNTVSTGNVFGGKSNDVAGGIVGKADEKLKITDNYTLVSIGGRVSGYAVVGINGTEDMLTRCYWSSTISKKALSTQSYCGDNYDVLTDSYRIVRQGKTAKVSSTNVKLPSWGKAVFSFEGELSSKSDNVSINSDSTVATISGKTIGNIDVITYYTKVTLPATVGAGSDSLSFRQFMHVFVYTAEESAFGDGSALSPFEISNTHDFGFLSYAKGIHVKLVKNFKIYSAPDFNGVFDGNGHTLYATGSVFSTVKGTVKNTNIVLTADVNDAVFPIIAEATIDGVSVAMNDGVKLNTVADYAGILADKVIGDSKIFGCRVKGSAIVSDKTIAFGGLVGNVAGEGVSIKDSGVVVNISGTANNNVTNLIGSVSAEKVKIENCYAAGENTVGKYMFIGNLNAKAITVNNIILNSGVGENSADTALDFDTYKGIIGENKFSEWKFNSVDGAGFFTGESGTFTSTLPDISAFETASAEDFTISFDSSKVKANVSVESGVLTLVVARAKGIVTVKDVVITVTENKTGLSASITVSNGLEKDSLGNWKITNAYDLTYLSENVAELSNESFIVTNDIDMSAADGFKTIGTTSVAFSGKFNGNGHTISNLAINGTAKTALFGELSDATVENLNVKNAKISSEGGYAAVLVGQAVGSTIIKNVNILNSTVTVKESYSAIAVASIDNAVKVQISDITIKNCSVESTAGYVGAVVGKASNNSAISNVTVTDFKAKGSDYISGVAGLVQGDDTVSIDNVKVNSADVSGVNNVSGIAAGDGKGVSIKNAEIKSSKVYTVSNEAPFTVGGIASEFDATIENVKAISTEISGGVAAGIVGRTTKDANLTVKNAIVDECKVSSSTVNTVAAGILGVHNVSGSVNISDSVVCDDAVIGSASISAGIVGDCSGADSILTLNSVKSFAIVNGCETTDAVAAAGVLGKLGTGAVNNVTFNNVISGGTVNGAVALGGLVGYIKDLNDYNGKKFIASDCIVFTQINAFDDNTNDGVIFGKVDSTKGVSSNDMNKALDNVIISTYYGAVPAFSAESGLVCDGVVDMDKPNGSAIKPSVELLNTNSETTVNITNTPKVDGFTFDVKTGWVSESDERVKVISGNENAVVLKANHEADISIVAYYVLDGDSNVRIPVHFMISSSIRTPLKGKGTVDDPYLVTCAYDLETVAQYSDEKAVFALTQDIEFTDADFEFGGAFYNVGNGVVTIGDATNGFRGTFTGLYNGVTHSIKGLKLAGNEFGGLFGATDGAVISDLIIKNADVSGLNYVGLLVGSSKNTTIKNITVSDSEVNAVEPSGYAGTLIGYAENTTVENINASNVAVKTADKSNGATVEIAGGLAGVFDGTINNVKFSKITVTADTVCGGVVGAVLNGKTVISNVIADVKVTAEVVGGIVGRTANPLELAVEKCMVTGEINGTKVSSGVIGEVSSDSAGYSVDKATRSIISDTVITAKISDTDVSGIAVGKATENIFCDKENTSVQVFDKVYYSSYLNNYGAFGVEDLNADQNSEYSVTDLNDIKVIYEGEKRDSLPLSTQYSVINDDMLIINGTDGTYKSFTVGGRTFMLSSVASNVKDAISYDSETSAMKLMDSTLDNIKAVFNYNDGLTISVNIEKVSVPVKGDTVSVKYNLVDATDGALGNKLVGIQFKSITEKETYSEDIFVRAGASAKNIQGMVVENGTVYVDAVLPENLKISVTAADENGNALTVADDGAVDIGSAKAVIISISVEKESFVEWGIRSIWGAIGK